MTLPALRPCPLVPTNRQTEFLRLSDDEALYGGAAGGGKSEALLRWLAECAHIPRYTGIIFRRTYPQLTKSNEGILEKSYRMYSPMGAVFNEKKMHWRWPSGAIIELGHLPYEKSVEDYQGPSYHRVCFDELTQFSERQYLYLKGRIRSGDAFPEPMGMRAGSNPGGPGHMWVKRRFVTPAALKALSQFRARDPSPPGLIFRHNIQTSEGPVSVAFVPARLADNPYVDYDAYAKNLAANDPVTKERLLNGDWSITEDSPIHGHWFRYYDTTGSILVPLGPDQERLEPFDERLCLRFMTVDTAGTSRDKADEQRGRAPAWSCAGVWDYHRRRDLLVLRHVWRARASWTELKEAVRGTAQAWNCRRVRIEDAHVGPALAEELHGLDVKLVGPVIPGMAEGHRGAKLDRAVASGLISRLFGGQLLLPVGATDWISDYEEELTSWSGGPDEVCDQIDMSSYAAYEARSVRASWGGTISTN